MTFGERIIIKTFFAINARVFIRVFIHVRHVVFALIAVHFLAQCPPPWRRRTFQ